MPTTPNSRQKTGQQIRDKAAEKANQADYKAIMKNVEKIRGLLEQTVEMSMDTTVEVRQKIRTEEFRQIARIFDKGHFLYNMMVEPNHVYFRPPSDQDLSE